ncbi:MAG: bifunctional 2-polyprenyl-6-hydroxyphenol methylase/3-demethylubiquinol 3-O-methyltransferase UbiG [Mariprofundaceae bacterium]|nr:bifunctional 2-polyprenyl-6-hydroxyphenol methylase/3-demethylubiquinol 3-O-methyltransferase UbiG [Mariprofundaceae bacterium]
MYKSYQLTTVFTSATFGRMGKNYDPVEIEKFESIAQEWWQEDGRFKPLHQINPLRVSYIAETTALQGISLLDVGCGGGILSEALARKGADVTGIDRSPKALNIARLHAQKSQLDITYEETDAATWAQSHQESYDVITCLEVLEHVPDVVATVQECASMLKSGGYFFFATLNRTPKAWVAAILGAEYILGWLPKGTHRYDAFIRPSEMVHALRQSQLDVQNMSGMSYRLLQQDFVLSDDLSINYLGVAIKP